MSQFDFQQGLCFKGFLNDLAGIPFGKHAQRFERESELVVRVRDAAALIENALDRFLFPLPIWLLTIHDEPDALLQRLDVGIVCVHQPDESPGRHDDLGAFRMLNVFMLFARLSKAVS